MTPKLLTASVKSWRDRRPIREHQGGYLIYGVEPDGPNGTQVRDRVVPDPAVEVVNAMSMASNWWL
jgi:hypothetical protein